MSDFPSSPAFSGPTPDVATGVPRLEAFLKATKQGIGRGLQALTIASGSITPADGVTGSIVMDTEGAAATDILTNIAQTNIPDGHYVMLQIADNGRVITIDHNAGGTGDIELTGSLDFEMNRVEQRLLLQRSGTTWKEVLRSGREVTHSPSLNTTDVLSAASTDPLVYYKDESGRVWLEGRVTKDVDDLAASNVMTLTNTALPAGYRPAADIEREILDLTYGTNLTLRITTAGVMSIWNRGSAAWADGDDAIISVSYRAAA